MPSSPIPRLVLATLAGLPVAGCSSTWNCHPDEEDFAVDRAAEAGWLRDAGIGEGEGARPGNCDVVCRQAYEATSDWYAADVWDCALALDSAAYTEDAPDDAAVGWIECEGLAIEGFCEGRRPLGHVEAAGAGDDHLGRVLATLAHLEAASVTAFEELAGFLGDHGAPAVLVTRCLDAADDERRHAAWLSALARERGATVPVPRTLPCPTDLRAVALHNAVEGCVHETWAALEAHLAAARAHDPRLRAAWARIARDEATHAQLSWDLHAWLLARLSRADRAAVRAAQAEALAALPARARAVSAAVPRPLGFPTVVQADALARDLAARLAA